MTRPWRVLPVLAAAAVGCAGINALKTKAPDPGTNEGRWAIIRDQATRRAIVYDQFVHRATLTATYLSPEVREARARRMAEWLGWTEQELDARLAAEAAEAALYDDFLFALFTADSRSNDLDSPTSVWRLAIKLDGSNELVTRDAKAQDVDATLRNLFPYVGVFDSVYRVRFNRAPGKTLGDRRFGLEVASALGKMEMTYGDGQVGPDRPQGSPIQ